MRTTLTAAGLAGAGYWAAWARAGWIRRQPDRYPLVRLRQEPTGAPVAVVRPDGTRIQAVRAGAGPPVVLAHGYGVSLLEWNVVADGLLDRGYQVIAFDQRGHGQSTLGSDGVGSAPMAEDYLAVLDHFGVHDGVLVGHSLGGFLAVRLLLDHPDLARRLRGLVLFAAFAGRILQGAPQNWLQLPLLRWGILQRVAATRTGGSLLGASLEGDTPSPAEITVFLEVFLRQDHRAVLGILDACAKEDNYPRLGEIRVPTVVICGSKDKSTPPHHSQHLAAIPNARMVSVPGGGHLLNWEAPDTLIQAVQTFPPLPPPTPQSTCRAGSDPYRAPGQPA